MGKRKILFITSLNLASNPRLVKEIKLASDNGYSVQVICFSFQNWSGKNDIEIKQRFENISIVTLDATRRNYIPWLFFSVLEKAAKILWPAATRSLLISALSNSKRSLQLLWAINRVALHTDDLIVAHNLPAFYPALKKARACNCFFGVDLEDYHPGEKIEPYSKYEKKRRELLFKAILPHADYITAASEQIADTSMQLVPGSSIRSILNFFPSSEFLPPQMNNDKKIKLIWFSQNINYGRGLETLLDCWDTIKDKVEITLIGNLAADFFDQYLKDKEGIIIRQPVSQQILHKELKNYDVGLALESKEQDFNRDICITNKLLAYFQAGLYILATDTTAQTAFLKDYAEHGTAFANETQLMEKIIDLYLNLEGIRAASAERYKHASSVSWEKESILLKNIWDSCSAA